MTSFSTVLQPDKRTPLDVLTPDYSTASLEFESGPVARLTTGLYAAHDHSLRVFGDAGSLAVKGCWDYGATVFYSRRHRLTPKVDKYPILGLIPTLGAQRLPLVRPAKFKWKSPGANPMDFCRGIAELADAATRRRQPLITARWSLHVNEIVLTMQDPAGLGSPRALQSRFEPLQPAPWAR